MKFAGSFRSVVLIAGLFLLAACDSAEDRAEGHYQRGVELLEAGDVERGLVELRNVFNLNPNHRDARALYAVTVLEQGQTREAFSQYLRLVEQHPDDLEGLIVLATLAIEGRDWESADRYAARAMDVAPESDEVQIIDLVMRYRNAGLEGDDPLRAALIDDADALLDLDPASILLHNILIEGAVWRQDFPLALTRVDAALVHHPDAQHIYMVRLSVLDQLGETEEIEAQLLRLVEQFPDVPRYSELTLQFYNQQQTPEKAEDFLRSTISPEDEDLSRYVGFIRYLRDTRGLEFALAELEQAQEVASDRPVLQALEASLIFDLGRRDEGIAKMQAIVDGGDGSPDILRFNVALAQMLLATGNEVGARRLVEETLAADSTNVDAIKLQASWLIDGDDADGAISLLRTALDQAPDDATLMTLIASAHARNGDRELSRDLLSLAAETSGFAPPESMRYAQVLVSTEEYLAAEDVLVNSLRRFPSHVGVLNALGDVYVRSQDWSRAEHVERTLRGLDRLGAAAAADGIRLGILRGQDRQEDALNFLAEIADDGRGNFQALALSVQTRLRNGEEDQARVLLQDALANDPDRFELNFLAAAVDSATGKIDSAEQNYRALTERDEATERVWVELVRLLNRNGRPDEAAKAIEDGLQAFPGGANLLWAKASMLEADQDIDGAIAIYETLYEQSTTSLIVANNLASLLSTYREDPDSIERAYQIARRLRGSTNPAFQDTYGWLAYRRADYEDALAHLEPAAASLSSDPIVQYHLGMVYLAVDRPDDAVVQFNKALELVAPDDQRAQFDRAREELAKLEAATE